MLNRVQAKIYELSLIHKKRAGALKSVNHLNMNRSSSTKNSIIYVIVFPLLKREFLNKIERESKDQDFS